MDRYNVIWTSPSENSSGSMPLGNGDIGLNVWVETDGDVRFYIGKTDAWNENGRLLKLGRVRIRLSPNPFAGGKAFRQTLRLRQGQIVIHAEPVEMVLWVDAHQPVIRVEVIGKEEFDLRVSLETWRTETRALSAEEVHSAYGLHGGPDPVLESPDTVLSVSDRRIVWCHRNPHSIWEATLTRQGLGEWMNRASDPILHRTFGGAISGDGLVRENATSLKSAAARNKYLVSIYPLTGVAPTEAQWLAQLDRQIAQIESTDEQTARRAHLRWWNEFWDRSWIYVTGSPEAEQVTRGYVLQRFINACGGRGRYPIKFNGSIFTVDSREPGRDFDADFRLWGGPYWFQNTRLSYWPMLAGGDFDLMMPLFNMYRDALPLAEARTKIYFGHEGAFFPETMYFWGAYADANYGWDRRDRHVSHVENTYIRHYWSGALELIALMLEYLIFTEDWRFAENTLLPLARAILAFYDRHYPRDAGGKLWFKPAQSLETWQDVENPLPEIAGLRFVLPQLLALPDPLIDPDRHRWRQLLDELPALPLRQIGGRCVLAPAERIFGPAKNVENPELYAVFPYRLYGVGAPDLAIGRRTYFHRRTPGNNGWQQDSIQAAMLGLTAEAQKLLTERFAARHPGSRFEAFFGPNFDWIPDQDHGNVAAMTLQAMLVQTRGSKIYLLPAWPRDWDADFRLCGPFNATLTGIYQNGRWKNLDVNPAGRRGDVIEQEPQ